MAFFANNLCLTSVRISDVASGPGQTGKSGCSDSNKPEILEVYEICDMYLRKLRYRILGKIPVRKTLPTRACLKKRPAIDMF